MSIVYLKQNLDKLKIIGSTPIWYKDIFSEVRNTCARGFHSDNVRCTPEVKRARARTHTN